MLLVVLVVAAWVAWVACCAQLLRAVVVHLRRGEVGLQRGSPVLDRLAARIAFGVLALTTAGTPLALSTAAGASTPSDGATRSAMMATVPAVTAWPAAASVHVHTVQPGDSLWRIADERLGDGADWTAIAALNLGRDVGQGARFVDPDQLRAGWHLRLPEAGRHENDDRARDDGGPAPAGHLPELIALGLGSLACAALARRARQRRRLGERFSADALPQPVLSEGAVDTSTLLHRFAGVPALESFEAANCLLALALDRDASIPAVRSICVSESGVTFFFATTPTDEPPAALRPWDRATPPGT